MTRSLPPSLAGFVESWELTQPELVTMAELTQLAEQLSVKTDPKVLAGRLREHGWLLPTGTAGVWEFAPGAHAGAYGHGDPTVRFRAALARRPQIRSALALGTAVWAHGLADRLPDRLEVAVPKGDPVPAGLSEWARVSRFDANLDYAVHKRVPVHRLETVLIHLATRPNDVRSWSSVEEWLPDVAAAADADLVRAELAGRPNTVAVRTGYLLEGIRPDLSQELRQHVAGKVWFGPRGRLRRHSEAWQVADTILPFRPSQLRLEGKDR